MKNFDTLFNFVGRRCRVVYRKVRNNKVMQIEL